MKQFFYKSGLIIAILIMVSVIFTLCGIAVVNEKNIYKPIPQMSSDYVIFYPQTNDDSKWQEYASSLKSISEYRVKGIKFQNGCAVDFNRERYEGLKLKSGRLFSQEEYVSRANVALVREDMLELCHYQKGCTWLPVQNVYYKVVGVFSKGNSNDSRSNKYLLNLYAKGMTDQMEGAYGFYDNGEQSLENFKTSVLAEEYGVYYNFAAEEGENLNKNVQSNVKGALAMYLSVGVVVLLNIFSAIYIWLRGKRKEIVLRKMVGARKYQIFLWIVKNFMIFVMGTFILGLGIVKLILFCLNQWEFSPSMLTIFGTEMEWMGIGMALIVVNFIGFVIISITVSRYLKREIIQLIRQE